MSRLGDAGRRDDAGLASSLTAWGRAHFGEPGWQVLRVVRPASGWSNETVVLTVADGAGPGRSRVVVRMPSRHPVFPDPSPATEAAVLEALSGGPVPVPGVVAVEEDPGWVGSPFLVTTFEEGRPGPEAPPLDPNLTAASVEAQRRLQESFLATLAALHRFDWRGAGLGEVLRGGDGNGYLAAEVRWWQGYVDWATEGEGPAGLAEALDWCAKTVPGTSPPSLCWGDARIGNLLLGDDLGIRVLLDWEGAWIGPGEADLAWYLALEGMVERLTGRSVPGFCDRDGAVAAYESAAGRSVRDLRWHEVFALVRSVAVSERLARLASEGKSGYRGPAGEANPVLAELGRLLETAA